ncbi:AraC family transcriptional regulator, partial [Klebsiella oxytoca]
MKENVFNEIVEWIEARLTTNPSVEDIARGVGYSRRSVYNIFHEYAGLPVGKYIRMRRMTLAAGKLRLTHQPISSIALMNPLMILVKIIKLRWIHILSYDQMVSRKINNQTTRCANS